MHNSQMIAWKESTVRPSQYVHSFFHSHQAFEVVMVTEGAVRVHFSGRSYDACPGDILVFGSMESHVFEITDFPYSRTGIRFSREALRRTIQYPALSAIYIKHAPDFCHLLPVPREAEEPRRLLEEIQGQFRQKAPFYLENMLYLLGQFTVSLYRCCPACFPVVSASGHQSVYEVLEYLESHYAENIHVEELARHFYMSSSHLAHTFRDLTGHTPRQYLTLCRLSRARELLAATDLPLEDVAARCGFDLAGTLIRSFKKEYNITPGAFRKSVSAQQSIFENGLDIPVPDVMDTFHVPIS